MIDIDADYIRRRILTNLKDPFQELLYSLKQTIEHNARFNRTTSYYCFKAPFDKATLGKAASFLTRRGFTVSFKMTADNSLLIFTIDL